MGWVHEIHQVRNRFLDMDVYVCGKVGETAVDVRGEIRDAMGGRNEERKKKRRKK